MTYETIKYSRIYKIHGHLTGLTINRNGTIVQVFRSDHSKLGDFEYKFFISNFRKELPISKPIEKVESVVTSNLTLSPPKTIDTSIKRNRGRPKKNV